MTAERFKPGDRVRFVHRFTNKPLGQYIREGTLGLIVGRDGAYPDDEYYEVRTTRRVVGRVHARHFELIPREERPEKAGAVAEGLHRVPLELPFSLWKQWCGEKAAGESLKAYIIRMVEAGREATRADVRKKEGKR